MGQKKSKHKCKYHNNGYHITSNNKQEKPRLTILQFKQIQFGKTTNYNNIKLTDLTFNEKRVQKCMEN